MALILDGTNGLSDVDGTAGTPAIRGSDANTGIFFPAADTIAFAEGGVEVARFDASGNLGIGVTPSAWSGFPAIQFVSGYSVSPGGFGQNTYFNSGFKNITTGGATLYQPVGAAHIWYNAPSGAAGAATALVENMRIDSSGNLLVGQTVTGRTDTNGFSLEPATGALFQNHVTGTVSGTFFTRFSLAATQIGSISQSGTTAVAYTTSSDYRLKHDIQPMTGALARVAALKPVTYKWNVDNSVDEGFIAHELAEVCPSAVVGEKNAVDAEGNPQYQGIDTSFLVATLTAAIQEQQALITSLTARVAALEGQA